MKRERERDKEPRGEGPCREKGSKDWKTKRQLVGRVYSGANRQLLQFEIFGTIVGEDL